MAPPRLPSVSVVVPTHGRAAQLAACLSALRDLHYPRGRLEIVVVDDGSPTPVDSSLEEGEPDVRIVRRAHAGPAAARNTGAGLADGELLAFVDDDCVPDASWLERLVPHLGGDRPTIAGGRTVNALPDNAFSDASQALVSYLYAYYSARRPDRLYFTTNNLAVRREEFLASGGFDTRFPGAAGEDREFCVRCALAGFALVHEPRAVVRHRHVLGPRSYWRQHLAYGRAARTYHSLTGEAPGARFERPEFYARLLLYPRTSGMRRPLRAGVLLALAQLASAAGYALGPSRRARPTP